VKEIKINVYINEKKLLKKINESYKNSEDFSLEYDFKLSGPIFSDLSAQEIKISVFSSFDPNIEISLGSDLLEVIYIENEDFINNVLNTIKEFIVKTAPFEVEFLESKSFKDILSINYSLK
jgi:hypothetical protein